MDRRPWQVFGSARGPVMDLAPSTRILVTFLVLCACILAPAGWPAGLAFLAATVAGWLVLCLPSVKVVSVATCIGLAGVGPYLLVLPLVRADQWQDRAAVALALFVRGMASVYVTIAAASTFNKTGLWHGLFGLPLPRLLVQVVAQIMHQADLMWVQARQVADAIAVRARTCGPSLAWRVMKGLPSVWLPRVVHKAQAQARAIELRGYCQVDPRLMVDRAARALDCLAVLAAIVHLGLAILLRARNG